MGPTGGRVVTASEQHAEYAEARTLAHSVTDSVSPEQRAAIEADYARRLAEKWQTGGWTALIDNPAPPGAIPSIWAGQVVTDWLRAEADRIEEGAR